MGAQHRFSRFLRFAMYGLFAVVAVAAVLLQFGVALPPGLVEALGLAGSVAIGGAYLDLPAENAGLKEWYDGQKVENLAYDENPLLAMVPKKPNATGKYVPIPCIYEVSQGRSAQFSSAQGNQTPMQLAEFLLTLRPDYSIATIGHQAALAAADEKGSFLDFAKEFIDIAVQSAALSAATCQYRAGTGSRGQISSITAGVITLTHPPAVSQFGINQTLQATPAGRFGASPQPSSPSPPPPTSRNSASTRRCRRARRTAAPRARPWATWCSATSWPAPSPCRTSRWVAWPARPPPGRRTTFCWCRATATA